MAHQSGHRLANVERNAHLLRMQRDRTLNDPNVSGLDKVVHSARLRDSLLMQRRADEHMSQADKVIEDSISAGSTDDLRFYPRVRSRSPRPR